MKRKTPLRRGAPPRRVNRGRAAKRKARDFAGPYADWIRAFPCCLMWKVGEVWCRMEGHYKQCADGVWRTRLSQAAHVKSRGAGGTAKHLIPLCAAHHWEQHTIGIKSFAKKYNVDLGAIAADLWGRYQRESDREGGT